MRWPWQRPETRSAGGGYTSVIVNAIEAAAAQKVADASATAGIEAAAGALSRAFACAQVGGPSWAQETINPVWLAQVGRSLIREGASLSVILMGRDGAPELLPAAYWNFETDGRNDESERNWMCRVSTYGPSSSHTRFVARDQLVYIRWGTRPGTPYLGQGPASWAALTARLHAEAERSLADEAAGALAQILPIPQDGGDSDGDEADDPLRTLKTQLAAARGKPVLVETTSDGWGEGQQAGPRKDWIAARLGPMPPEGMVKVADAAFARTLAACGASPALFDDSDGTAKREALRQWHMGTVIPMAKVLEYELSARLDTPIRLAFDSYPADMVSRSQVFAKLMAAEGMTLDKALAIAGMLERDG